MLIPENVLRRVNKAPHAKGCQLWTGPVGGKTGGLMYGRVYWLGKHWAVHRLTWTALNGSIPTGICVLHRCDESLCVNPAHLFLGTHKENMQDKVAKKRDTATRKTHCKRGHLRNDVNIWISKKGLKHCRPCHALAERRRNLSLS